MIPAGFLQALCHLPYVLLREGFTRWLAVIQTPEVAQSAKETVQVLTSNVHWASRHAEVCQALQLAEAGNVSQIQLPASSPCDIQSFQLHQLG